MLILTIDQNVEYIQVGDDIKIYLRAMPGRYLPKIKMGFDAPKHVKIMRSNAKMKEKEED